MAAQAEVSPVVAVNEGGLTVENLETVFMTSSGPLKALDKVSFKVRRGEVLGLVGESGSGKSVTGFSIMRLVSAPGRVVGGRVLLNDVDILSLPDAQMRGIRGAKISMIFQDSMLALNPVLSIGAQMVETIQAHSVDTREQAWERAREALAQVGIPSPEERLAAYPHQLSGGMRQRVVIAMALLHSPDLVIADEATTALDVTIQSQILSLIQDLCEKSGTSLIWITHDLSVVANIADSICVMYGGRVVESGSVDEVLGAPAHPYTRALMKSLPSTARRGDPLAQIPGTTPSLRYMPSGCAFHPRCERATAQCREKPPLTLIGEGRQFSCFHPILPEYAA